jgi:DNA ligase-associated metallophosphoesterase
MSENGAVAIVAGERLLLLGAGAIYWKRANTLLVADPHFGKAAAFRAAGVPVPRGTTGKALARLDMTLERTSAARIVFLGDFLHAKEGRAVETLRSIDAWRARHARVDMLLVRGNHDKQAGDPPVELDMRCAEAPVVEHPFVLAHHPVRSADGYVLCGHMHPAARLVGPGGERRRLPCFWFGQEIGVLPAFGEFTGLADIDPLPGDRVWVIADGEVIQMPWAMASTESRNITDELETESDDT